MRCAHRRVVGPAVARPRVVCQSQRQPKNPKAWRSMDELRDHLEQPQGMGGGISAMLNWISQNSFGAQGSKETAWSLGGMYRWLLRLSPLPRQRVKPSKPHRWDAPPELVERAEASPLKTILLVSPYTLAGMAIQQPSVLTMSTFEAVSRLTGLKALLPECDLSHLVVQEPRLYLGAPQEEVEQRIRASVGLLSRHHVPRAVINAMVMHDPGLPFCTTEAGVLELRQLWPESLVDEQALMDSDPRELALAVRALSTRLG